MKTNDTSKGATSVGTRARSFKPIMREIFTLAEDRRAKKSGLTPFETDVIEERVVYKTVDGNDYYLHLYLPKGEGRHPVFFFVPGGGWMVDNSSRRKGLGMIFAESGVAVAIVTHRLAPEYRFPSDLIDVIEGLNFLRVIADKYNLDADTVYAGGDSSGGHLVACLACAETNPEYRESMSLPALNVTLKRLVFISGAFDFNVMYRIPCTHLLIVRHFSGVKTRYAFRHRYPYYKQANPYNYLNADFPECFIAGGRFDFLCMGEAQRMHKRLSKLGVRSTLTVGNDITNGGHDYILRIDKRPARKDMLKLTTWYFDRLAEDGYVFESESRALEFLKEYKLN